MLYIDVGNTFRTGSRTGIQRVVRQLAYGLKRGDPSGTRLVVFDMAREGYVEITEPKLLSQASGLDDIAARHRRALNFADFAAGDVFLDIDSAWSEPLDRGSLYRFLKRRGVILVTLHYDATPILFPHFAQPDALVRFAQHLADQLQYSDTLLTISARVDRDLKDIARRLLGRSVTSQVIPLGADFGAGAGPLSAADFRAAFPALGGLRFMLAVGTIEPRKNHQLLLDAFDRLTAPDAGLVIVGRRGWMMEEFLARLHAHPEFGRRLFWHEGLEDRGLLALYGHAFVSVFPSTYEGFGLPLAEALGQGSATVCSDGGSLPEVAGAHAEIFASGNGEALLTILDRLYGDSAYHQRLRDRAATYVAPSWSGATERVQAILGDIASGDSHAFASPVRQMALLSVDAAKLDLCLQATRQHAPCIDRIVVLTSANARAGVEAVAARHFADRTILTDDEVAGGVLPSDHQARNTWLRKQLYRQPCIEPNFLAADEDALALQPVAAERYQQGGVHTGYFFLEDMGTWLAGSPTPTSFDGGIRNTWRLLREAGYAARAFASHMPQIINKSLVAQIFDRFVVDAGGPAYDEWSLYFNVAAHLYPAQFRCAPYATLGWPMRMGDWFPLVAPEQPMFENYYPQNYAPGGMFLGLEPLGDFAAKAKRTSAALARARRVELEGSGGVRPGQLVLVVGPAGLSFVAGGAVMAGKENVRRILLINGAPDGGAVRGKLEMFLAEASGALLRGEAVALGEVCWLPLVPPERPGLCQLRFFATLDSGIRLELTVPLQVVADAAGERP